MRRKRHGSKVINPNSYFLSVLSTVQGLAQAAQCTSLEQLDLSYCPLITPEGLRHLASQLPLLCSLRLMDCPRAVTVLGMRALGNAERLQSLHVGDNKRLDDGCMQVG